MNEEQRQQWKRALADKAARQRRQPYRPRPRGVQAVKGAGMVRIPPASERPATRTGRHSQHEG